MMKSKGITGTYTAVLQAFLAALLFGLNAPIAKTMLGDVPPMYMAAFLYLGAAVGMLIVRAFTRKPEGSAEAPVTRKDLPWVVLMVALDVAAPFLLMAGLSMTTATHASLLTNFEMVATTLFAVLFFREAVNFRIGLALGIITLASVVLCVDFGAGDALAFSPGSLLVLGACLCWGLENNCTRNLSLKDPSQIVVIKGFGSGLVALAIAVLTQGLLKFNAALTPGALVLGFVSYGLSIYFYVRAQRTLGAARTSMYYAAAPFFGVALSFLLLGERPGWPFFAGMALMAAGTALAIYEKHSHTHRHEALVHEHRHSHEDGHHVHVHDGVGEDPVAEHTHAHAHEALEHTHEHTPDSHHRHGHT